MGKEGTRSLTRDATNLIKSNYLTNEEDKKDYFTSARPTRVRDDEDDEAQLEDDHSISLPKPKILTCNFRKIVSNHSGSGKHFINTQQPSRKGSSDNSVIMRKNQDDSVIVNNDKSMIPYNKGIDDNIVRSGYLSGANVQKNEARTTKNNMAHSDNDIKQKARNFRFTSQIECLDKVASMISDEKEVKSN